MRTITLFITVDVAGRERPYSAAFPPSAGRIAALGPAYRHFRVVVELPIEDPVLPVVQAGEVEEVQS